MDNQKLMLAAALSALKNTMDLTSQDKLLILTDSSSLSITTAFNNAAQNCGCSVDTYLINDDERPIKNIPTELIDKLNEKTIVLNILQAFAEEISFRIKWIFAVEEKKHIRCAHMPGITEAMLTEGSLNIDYKQMRATALQLKKFLHGANKITITTKLGTNLTLGLTNRFFTDDTYIKPGEVCNLPCGEVYCAPIEDEAEGVLIIDASIGDIGLLKNPLKIFLEHGKIQRFESDDQELVRKITKLSEIDESAKIIGELGIGINPGARITGNMLEDEKAINTAHIAFGNNEDFGGGKNKSSIHRDFLFHKPAITAYYDNREKRIILENGNIIL